MRRRSDLANPLRQEPAEAVKKLFDGSLTERELALLRRRLVRDPFLHSKVEREARLRSGRELLAYLESIVSTPRCAPLRARFSRYLAKTEDDDPEGVIDEFTGHVVECHDCGSWLEFMDKMLSLIAEDLDESAARADGRRRVPRSSSEIRRPRFRRGERG